MRHLEAKAIDEALGPAAKVSIEVAGDGRVKLNVDKLGALGEPKSLTWLRQRVEKMLPKIDLPDLLFEVNAWTGFLDAFVHLGDGTTRMKDLPTSVVALLVSEACNIGLAPVVNPGYEALTRARLVHVDQYYLRADTIAAANARLIAAQESRHKLARDVCHGKRGTIHQAYRDGMEDQLGALGLVLNAIVLWTTKYIDAAVAQLRAEGHEIRDEDIARLSPLKHRNLNLLGRYSFTASVPAASALRPLRDPDASELDEDETGAE